MKTYAFAFINDLPEDDKKTAKNVIDSIAEFENEFSTPTYISKDTIEYLRTNFSGGLADVEGTDEEEAIEGYERDLALLDSLEKVLDSNNIYGIIV